MTKNGAHTSLPAGTEEDQIDLRPFSFDCRRWFPEIIAMVDRLAQGDPKARLEIDSDDEMLSALVDKLNRLAVSIEQSVDDSHEMAIGICEHYDTLNRIASGDLDARAPENSPNELIAKLGQLLNRSTSSLVQTIEELNRKDRELSLAYDTLSNIIEFLPDATFVIDRDKRVIAWNRAMEEMTGVPKEQMLGRGDGAYSEAFYATRQPILIDLLDLDQEQLSQRYLYAQRKGTTLFAENFISGFRGGDGAFIWITASPLLDSCGEQVGAIESVRDITDLKRTEHENAALQEQLRQSQKMEAIGQLAGGIAHDFNNILTAIIGYGQLIIVKSGDNSICRRYGEQIVAASDQAARLTRDLLAFGRRQVLDSQVCNLNTIVVSMNEMLRRLIGEDIVISVDLCPEPLMVMADAGQIRQVLMNLVTNARDAMPYGGQLTIRTEECREGGGTQHAEGRQMAVLSVGDTGVGMDQETCQKVFEPFFTTKQVGKGTGLGLAMVFGIVSQHGGTIGVESEPGQGTVLSIRLPLGEGGAPGGGKPSVEGPVASSVVSGTILLVEDNEISREVIRDILEDAGYRVVTAVDGIDAIEVYRARHHEIDLVILDVIMPRMNGREALDAIRCEGYPVRYLFMSGYTADIIHSKGRLEPELNYIAKPVMTEGLLAKVKGVLSAPPG